MDKIENLTPLTTLKHTCGNTAQTLDDVTDFVAQYTAHSGTNQETKSNVVRVTITVETNGIRYAWGATPIVDGGTALGHALAAGGSLTLTGHKLLTGFTFINKVTSSNAVLQITLEISV